MFFGIAFVLRFVPTSFDSLETYLVKSGRRKTNFSENLVSPEIQSGPLDL
jgi:hypothetical protein